jgi:hypothetical protein
MIQDEWTIRGEFHGKMLAWSGINLSLSIQGQGGWIMGNLDGLSYPQGRTSADGNRSDEAGSDRS